MTARSTIATADDVLPGVGCCSVCRQEPNTPAQYLDLSTVWLLPGPSGGGPVARRFCRGCAPVGPVAEIVCAHCGDGPLLAGALSVMDLQATAVVDGWLAAQGWRVAGPVCAGCVRELTR